MELDCQTVEDRAREYRDTAALYAVERQHVDILPEMFETGEFGWRDPEWVVQWYFRRFLGAYPDAERRAIEDAFGDNTYEAVLSAIQGAIDAEDAATALDRLTALDGVDVGVGSAFLQFIDPERYVVCSEREWATLRSAGELECAYPDPPSTADYEGYLETCRSIADRCGCSLLTLYRALWTLEADDEFGIAEP